MDGIQQTCPLCEAAATFQWVTQGKRFSCTNCTEFVIDSTAEMELIEMPEQVRTDFRAELAVRARTSGPDQILVLREPLPEETSVGADGIPTTALVGVYMRRLP